MDDLLSEADLGNCPHTRSHLASIGNKTLFGRVNQCLCFVEKSGWAVLPDFLSCQISAEEWLEITKLLAMSENRFYGAKLCQFSRRYKIFWIYSTKKKNCLDKCFLIFLHLCLPQSEVFLRISTKISLIFTKYSKMIKNIKNWKIDIFKEINFFFQVKN